MKLLLYVALLLLPILFFNFLIKSTTSYNIQSQSKYGYTPITLFNTSFFLVYNASLLFLVFASSIDYSFDYTKNFFDNIDNIIVSILLFLGMPIYIFNKIRIKTNAQVAIVSILTLEVFSSLLAIFCTFFFSPLLIIPFVVVIFGGQRWNILFTDRKC